MHWIRVDMKSDLFTIVYKFPKNANDSIRAMPVRHFSTKFRLSPKDRKKDKMSDGSSIRAMECSNMQLSGPSLQLWSRSNQKDPTVCLNNENVTIS